MFITGDIKFTHTTSSKIFFLSIIFLAAYFSITPAQPRGNILSRETERPYVLQNWLAAKDINPGKEFPVTSGVEWIPVWKLRFMSKDLTGCWLLKTDIFIPGTLPQSMHIGVRPQSYFSAYSIYWDNRLIAANGKPGKNLQEQKAGKYNFDFIISPGLLTPGKHTLLYRLSNYSDFTEFKWFDGFTVIGPYAPQVKDFYSFRYTSVFLAGILTIPFLFNLFLFFSRKFKTEHLLFSLVCFIGITDYILSPAAIMYDAPATIFPWMVLIYKAQVLLNSIIFPSYFIYSYNFRKSLAVAAAAAGTAIFFIFTTFWNMYSIMPVVIISEIGLLTLYAVWKKRKGSLIILAGIVIVSICYYLKIRYADLLTIMVVATSLSIAIEFAKKEKGEREALLLSARLENQLLKKNINPHFLMNTLTSIIAWLRKEPESAVKMIEALAEEFNMITQVSGLKLITMKQELDLCAAHLKIMSFRKGAELNLASAGIIDDELIPPMIFHTLIENGISHNCSDVLTAVFKLERHEARGETEFLLSNSCTQGESSKKISNGMGLNYVKSRLEESYPGRWTLNCRKNDSTWEVSIKIKNKNRHADINS